MKVAFFGTPQIAQIVLEKLIKSPYKPQIVVTSPDAKIGRGQKLEASPVKKTATEHNIKVLQPENLSFLISQLSTLNLDLAILVAYGKMIPDDVLIIPKFGFVNIHPSLLPKFRGPSPVTAPILAGDKTSGVSLIVLDSELDHGPIIAQKEVEIDVNDTHDSLASKLATIGADLLIRTLPQYLEQNITPQAQDHNLATFTQKITKESGKIDINNPPDQITLDRMVRAYFPWPTVWFELEKKRFKLLPATRNQQPATFLIQPEGKKPMTIKEFLNGYTKYKEVIGKIFNQEKG